MQTKAPITMGMHSNNAQVDLEVMAHEYACSAQMSWGSGGLDLPSVKLSVDHEDERLFSYSPQAASHQPGQVSAAESGCVRSAELTEGDTANARSLHLQQHAQPAQLQHWQLQTDTAVQQLTVLQQQALAVEPPASMTYMGFHMQQQHQQQARLYVQQQQPSQQQESGHHHHQQQWRWQPRGSCSIRPAVSVKVPALDLSRVKMGSSSQIRNLSADEAVANEAVAEKEAELCFERGSIRQSQLHPNAPLQDSRCYVYRAVGSKEMADFQELLSRLPEWECGQVVALWDALLVARHDCEAMAARGVRISRAISRDWQETVSDLIDRVVAQDNELGQLRQQLKAMQAVQATALSNPSPGSPAAANLEELHAQVVRLKRQRDLLKRDQQELNRAKTELQQALDQARQDAAAAKDQRAAVNAYASALREQHISLLHQLSAADTMGAALAAKQSTPADPDQDRLDQASKGSESSFAAAKNSCGRRSPLAGVFAGAADAGCSAVSGAAVELTLDLSCGRLGLPGMPPTGRSRCTTPSPRSSSTAFNRKLNVPPFPGLPCRRGDRGSGTSSPKCAAILKPGALLTSATATGRACTPGRSSDDAPDTSHERLDSAYPLIPASYEVGQCREYDPLDVLGVAGSKGTSRLQLGGPLAVLGAAATKLTPRLGGTPRLASYGDESRAAIWQTVEAYTQKLNLLDACYAAT